jgi:uncharacterized coiled-coil protein SlyX
MNLNSEEVDNPALNRAQVVAATLALEQAAASIAEQRQEIDRLQVEVRELRARLAAHGEAA